MGKSRKAETTSVSKPWGPWQEYLLGTGAMPSWLGQQRYTGMAPELSTCQAHLSHFSKTLCF